MAWDMPEHKAVHPGVHTGQQTCPTTISQLKPGLYLAEGHPALPESQFKAEIRV